jgi:hypothetical protein
MIRSTQSTVKALPERLHISIGGYFGPCYSVTLEEGRLIYAYSARGADWRGAEAGMATGTKIERAPGTEPAPGT